MQIILTYLDGTNRQGFELLALIGEEEGRGYPVAMLLLGSKQLQGTQTKAVQTAKSRAKHKVIESWLRAVKALGLQPKIAADDKDFAQIEALIDVWPEVQVGLCLWHAKDAVKKRLHRPAPKQCHYYFDEVQKIIPDARADFVPANNQVKRGQKRTGETLHGMAVRRARAENPEVDVSTVTMAITDPDLRALIEDHIGSCYEPNDLDDPFEGDGVSLPKAKKAKKTSTKKKKDDDDDFGAMPPPASQSGAAAKKRKGKGKTKDLEIDTEPLPSQNETEPGDATVDTARHLCPADDVPVFIAMIERHLNYHAEVPIANLGRRSPDDIYRICARQAYRACEKRKLPDLWCYLWNHWYRPARWITWARSAHPLLPIWRTTMAVESFWSNLKREYIGSSRARPALHDLIRAVVFQMIPVCVS